MYDAACAQNGTLNAVGVARYVESLGSFQLHIDVHHAVGKTALRHSVSIGKLVGES